MPHFHSPFIGNFVHCPFMGNRHGPYKGLSIVMAHSWALVRVLLNPTRSMVCRSSTCRRFITEVWRCSVCQLPSPIAEENCHQWMCKGTKKASSGTKNKVMAQDAAEWESSFKMRLESARQKSMGRGRWRQRRSRRLPQIGGRGR